MGVGAADSGRSCDGVKVATGWGEDPCTLAGAVGGGVAAGESGEDVGEEHAAKVTIASAVDTTPSVRINMALPRLANDVTTDGCIARPGDASSGCPISI